MDRMTGLSRVCCEETDPTRSHTFNEAGRVDEFEQGVLRTMQRATNQWLWYMQR